MAYHLAHNQLNSHSTVVMTLTSVTYTNQIVTYHIINNTCNITHTNTQ